MIEFEVDIQDKKSVPVVKVKGELDIYTCPKLNTKLSEIIANGKTRFILDLEGTSYIDSTGLGAIAHSARTVSPDQGGIYVICTQPKICKLFKMSGLDKKNIWLFNSEADAFSSIED